MWTQKNPWTDELVISLRDDGSRLIMLSPGVSWQHLIDFHRDMILLLQVCLWKEITANIFSGFNFCKWQNSFWFQKKQGRPICLIRLSPLYQ